MPSALSFLISKIQGRASGALTQKRKPSTPVAAVVVTAFAAGDQKERRAPTIPRKGRRLAVALFGTTRGKMKLCVIASHRIASHRIAKPQLKLLRCVRVLTIGGAEPRRRASSLALVPQQWRPHGGVDVIVKKSNYTAILVTILYY